MHTDTKPDLEYLVADTSIGDRVDVVVHNDDVTPMDFVMIVLYSIFELDWPRARDVMYRAHFSGRAHVATLPIEEAKYRVGHAHSAARLAGYPLAFTIEQAG